MSEVPEVRVLRLQPGDKLAVFLDRTVSYEDVREIRYGIVEWSGLPTDSVAMFTGGVRLEILRED